MSPRTVRRLVLVVFVAGIGGMILGSILDSNGVAITFGLVTATAALGLILVTMVVPPDAFRSPRSDPGKVPLSATNERRNGGNGEDRGDGDEGEMIEEQVARLVDAGAEEHQVRELVRRVMAYARRTT